MASPADIEHGRVIGEWFVAMMILGYFFPTIVAFFRGTNWGGTFIVNLLLGWSGLGWIIALIMACAASPRRDDSPPLPHILPVQVMHSSDPRWQPGRLRDAYSERREPRF